MPDFPCFLVLPDLSDDRLLAVASDSCILFDIVFGDPTVLLSVIRSNELADAKLAMARVVAEAAKDVVNFPSTSAATKFCYVLASCHGC